MRHKLLILLILTLFGAQIAQSQELTSTESFQQKIYFRDAYRYVEPSYRQNHIVLDKLKTYIDSVQRQGTLQSIDIQAWASPTGADKYNKRLAENRSNELSSWIVSNCNVTEDKIQKSSGGVGWDILRSQLESSDVAYSQKVIDIIDNVPIWVFDKNGTIISGRKKVLMELDYGRTWNDMRQRFFPDIRSSLAVVINTKIIKAVNPEIVEEQTIVDEPQFQQEAVDTITIQPAATDSIPKKAVPVADDVCPKLYVKTNLLGLGLAIANAAVEIDLCRHLSFNLPVYYSAWNYFSSTVKFRTLALQPELRYWFSDNNDGWFAGAHFGLAYYNIATDGEYRTQDHDGNSPALGGGLAVGYRLPISKDNRWKIEFSIGAGAYKLHYDKFRNYPNGLLTKTEKKTYIGIDRASVSFSYTFDLKGKEDAK